MAELWTKNSRMARFGGVPATPPFDFSSGVWPGGFGTSIWGVTHTSEKRPPSVRPGELLNGPFFKITNLAGED